MQHTLGLCSPLPTLPDQRPYRLLHVGQLAFEQPNTYSAFLAFQPLTSETLLTCDDPPIIRQARITHAAVFTPNTVWNERGLHLSNKRTSNESRLLLLGPQAFALTQLRHLPVLAHLRPHTFWSQHQDMWVATISIGPELVIIPCFELLRALYYYAGPRIINYCFSQLPWDMVAQLHQKPTAANDFQAQLLVAAPFVRNHEALVLGGLATDPIYLQELNQAHAWWQSAHLARTTPGVPDLPMYAKTAGRIGQEAVARAEGIALGRSGHSFFWVCSITLLESHYVFRSLVYHGVLTPPRSLREKALPFCSDLLRYPYRLYSAPLWDGVPETCLPTAQPHHGPCQQLAYLQRWQKHSQPPIMQGRHWARLSHPHAAFKGCQPLTSSVASYEVAPSLERYTHAVARLIDECQADGFVVELLQLDNEAGHFGADVSVFPHQGAAPLPGPAYQSWVRRFQLARIRTPQGVLFLLHVHHLPKLVFFCQKSSLDDPTRAEWQHLLEPLYLATADIQVPFQRLVTTTPRGRITGLLVCPVALAPGCLEAGMALHKHAAQYLLRELTLVARVASLYPDGLRETTWQRLHSVLVALFLTYEATA